MNTKITTILVISTLVYQYIGHCRYDMNLEYIEIANIEGQLNSQIKKKLDIINQQDNQRIQDKEYFVQVVSKQINVQNYSKAFEIKKRVIQNNINMILANNCKPTNIDVQYIKTLGSGHFGDVALTNVNIAGDKITYNINGTNKLVVKAMKNDWSSGINETSFYNYLSNISKEVRSGQCLYNIFNYDMDGAKYAKIEKRMIRRDRYLTDVFLGLDEPFKNLDAVGIIDCQYYTPQGKATLTVPGTNINENTKFYLAMPAMDGTMEGFFFDKPNYIQKNPSVFQDTVKFRLSMCFKMVQALKNIHEMGFINKDLKPENFLFKIHETTSDEYNIVLSIADFGLAGIDDYNTYQYSDVSYRPFDNYTLMSKELDVYQLGISMFQVIYNIPKEFEKSVMTLQLLNTVISSSAMTALFTAYYSNSWTVLNQFQLDSYKLNCVKDLVGMLYEKLLNYSHPNNDYENDFNFFFYEMNNVPTYMNNRQYEQVTNQIGFQIAARSFFLANFMKNSNCTRYTEIDEFFGNLLRRAIHPDPTARISSLVLFEQLSSKMPNIMNYSGMNRIYQQYQNERLVI